MADDDPVPVLVEIPKGSRNKYEVDPETGRVELDRRLFASVSYPAEYGYVPDTHVEDGDELDALVCTTEPTFPGCLVRTRPVALLQMRMGEEGPGNPKLVCVPLRDPTWDDVEDLDDLPAELRAEIEHFFDVYKDLEGSDVVIEGWSGREDALACLNAARSRAASQ
jgi:inorganic pyrophosphatase